MRPHPSTTWRAAYSAARFCGRTPLGAAIYATRYARRRAHHQGDQR